MAPKQATPHVVVVVMVVAISLLVVNCVSATPSDVLRKYSSTTIQKVNREGPYIGLITVYSPEERAFLSTGAFQPHPIHPFLDLSGRRFRVGKIHGKNVIYVRCGVGMRNAASATQQMVDLFDVSGIIHFGISGTANSSLTIGDVIIPKQFAHTGLWDWLNPNAPLRSSDIAHLDVGSYNVPKEEVNNLLGRIGFSTEEYYSKSGQPNIPQKLLWVETSRHWLHIASKLEGIELERCLNSSFCLLDKPKLVIGLRGSTSDIFVDNGAYREFLFKTFGVSSVDMESVSVVLTSLSNGFPVIVVRGLSDLAGAQAGKNPIREFGPLASLNVAKAVIQFIKILPGEISGI